MPSLWEQWDQYLALEEYSLPFFLLVLSVVSTGIYALILLLIKLEYGKDCISRWRTVLFEYGKDCISRWRTVLKTFIFTGQFVPIPARKNEDGFKLHYGIAIALGTMFYVFLELLGYQLPV
jgi:hypothetical protein